MSATAERIPLLIPPTGTENPVGDAVLCRAMTHRGLVRLHNEDAFCVETKADYHLFAIADGLGGHRGGSIASEMAIDTIKNEFEKWNGKGKERFVVKAINAANMEVFNTSQSHPELFNMQTTATAVVLESDSLAIAHVGDCRLYRVRNGRASDINQGPFAGGGTAQDASDFGEGRAAASREASINQVGRFFAFFARRPGKRENQSRRFLCTGQ